MQIPEIMKTLSGQPVKDVATWETYRRGELLDLFAEHIYGVRDIERPEGLYFKLLSEKVEYGMRVKDIRIGFDDFSFPIRLYLPLAAGVKYPVFVDVMHERAEDEYVMDGEGNFNSPFDENTIPFKRITDRGFAIAAMPTRYVYPDWKWKGEFKKGVFAAVKNQKGRTRSSWASISAWAWGVSRVIDYLETDPDIDATKVASIGHSRAGKTALYAAVTDNRILLSVPNNSGCMGAAVLRNKKGEHAVDINISDWFCDRFKDYNDREEMLPVDQHMLLALVAPRYLYVTDSIEDEWADPDAELLSCRLASEAYELYGYQGVVVPEKPMVDEVYQEGRIAFHVKSGDHSQTIFDWENNMDYFEKILKGLV